MALPSCMAFIGLGVMGYPMAGHLAHQGITMRVFNRTRRKADHWVTHYGGSAHDTPAQAAQGADLVLVCVGNDNDVRSVTQGEHGALDGMSAGSVLVDHTTTSADLARELATACQERHLGFVDAPVSGGEQGAQKGALTIMCGGLPEHFEQVESTLAHYARAISLMGAVGAGQTAKMVNQICIAGLVQGLAEGLHFAAKAGLDRQAVIDVISKGAAGSWQMDNRHATMIDDDYDHGFAVDWMRKDLDICLAEARRLDASLPVTALVDQFYADIQRMGGGRLDTSSLLKRLEQYNQA